MSEMETNKTHHVDALEFIKSFDGKVDLIVSDPPYEFQAMGGGIHRIGRGEVKYQNIIDIETNHFDFDKYIPPMLSMMGDKVNAYFFCNKTLVPKYLTEAVRGGLHFDILCIRKTNPIPAKNSSYCPELEYIIFLRSPGVYFDGSRKLQNYKKVFDVNIGGEENIHPNQKPVELIRRFIENSCPIGGVVFDPFMGSGTTGVAAVQTGRKFIGCEINPKFVEMSNTRTATQKNQNNMSKFI